jgi:hypothetical protein
MPHNIPFARAWMLLAALASLTFTVQLAAPTRVKAATAPPAESLYNGAFQLLRHVQRFQFHENVVILHQIQNTQAATTQTDIKFLAPNRVTTSLQTSRPSHGVSHIEITQVGTTKCQRPPRWICFRSAEANPAAYLRLLLSPQMTGVTFRATTVGAHSLNARTTIHLSWHGRGIVYSSFLLLQPKTGLPLTFRSSVTMHGELEVQQSAWFEYAKRFSITLPPHS